MTKFIYPVCDAEDLTNTIKTVMAKDHAEAKERITARWLDLFWDIDADDWDDFIVKMAERNVYIGEPQDIDTL